MEDLRACSSGLSASSLLKVRSIGSRMASTSKDSSFLCSELVMIRRVCHRGWQRQAVETLGVRFRSMGAYLVLVLVLVQNQMASQKPNRLKQQHKLGHIEILIRSIRRAVEDDVLHENKTKKPRKNRPGPGPRLGPSRFLPIFELEVIWKRSHFREPRPVSVDVRPFVRLTAQKKKNLDN